MNSSKEMAVGFGGSFWWVFFLQPWDKKAQGGGGGGGGVADFLTYFFPGRNQRGFKSKLSVRQDPTAMWESQNGLCRVTSNRGLCRQNRIPLLLLLFVDTFYAWFYYCLHCIPNDAVRKFKIMNIARIETICFFPPKQTELFELVRLG